MKKKLFFILGPTAVGKTDLALQLAEQLNTEIISCDSRQVYIDMNIGTSKPSEEQQKRVKHHIIDVVYPNIRYTVYDYVRDAKAVINVFERENKIPLIVGGTGLYAKLLVDGIFEMPPVPPEVNDRVKSLSKEDALKELEKVDPASYNAIPHNDLLRVKRALIVFYTTGKTIGELKKQTKPNDFEPYFYVLTRERSELYTIINNRVAKMVQLGLLEEVKYIIEKYFNNSLRDVFNGESRALMSIGYEEILRYLSGEFDYSTAIELIKRNSRRFAKRQITFFKQFPSAHWLNLSELGEKKTLEILQRDIFEKYVAPYKK